jgi:hypothetical protein
MGETHDDLEVREATDEDLPAILRVLESSLGWVPDEQYAAFYRWKHHDNPFGRSPAWVAVDGDRIVGSACVVALALRARRPQLGGGAGCRYGNRSRLPGPRDLPPADHHLGRGARQRQGVATCSTPPTNSPARAT